MNGLGFTTPRNELPAYIAEDPSLGRLFKSSTIERQTLGADVVLVSPNGIPPGQALPAVKGAMYVHSWVVDAIYTATGNRMTSQERYAPSAHLRRDLCSASWPRRAEVAPLALTYRPWPTRTYS